MAQKAATVEISELMQFLRSLLHDLPDERKPGNNTKYQVEDAVMAAFSVFFTQSPSFLSQVTTHIKNKKLTVLQLDQLKKLIQSSGFMNLAAEYGTATNQRYYPYSISVCIDNKEKKVFLRSNPSNGKIPEAFRVVEDYLRQLIK